MAYEDIHDAGWVKDPVPLLQKQVIVAMVNAAAAVVAEDPGTTNHAERLVWAEHVQADHDAPVVMADRWMHRVVENSTIQAGLPTDTQSDADVQFVVNGLVNTMAGV